MDFGPLKLHSWRPFEKAMTRQPQRTYQANVRAPVLWASTLAEAASSIMMIETILT